MVVVIWVIMQIDFQVLWRYFAWCNQALSVITLWAITVYLSRHKKPYIISLIPALFMTVVCTSYILCAPRPEGFGLSLLLSEIIGLAVATTFAAMFFISKRISAFHKFLSIQSQSRKFKAFSQIDHFSMINAKSTKG
jgi:carbon starvation protein CstA